MKQPLGSHKMADSLLLCMWMKKLPLLSREVLTSFKLGVSTVELTETSPRSKISVTVSSKTSVDSIWQTSHLTSQMNAVLKHENQKRLLSCIQPLKRRPFAPLLLPLELTDTCNFKTIGAKNVKINY